MKSIAVAAAAVLLALGLAGCTQQASVGECAKPLDPAASDVDLAEVDCNVNEAMYRLASREKRTLCPSGDYVEEDGVRSRKTGKTRYCYVLNVKEGDCLKPVGEFHERVACGTTPVQKVSKVVKGKANRALCGTGDDVRTYSEPATTICITK